MHKRILTPSLYTPDLDTTIAFYTDVLGFELAGDWKEAGTPIWADVRFGDAHIWFFSQAIPDRPEPALSGLLYLFVEDVDAVYKRLEGRVTCRWGPEDQPYGLRELGIEDINGYLLVFAQDI